jgi:hypothetical protein
MKAVDATKPQIGDLILTNYLGLWTSFGMILQTPPPSLYVRDEYCVLLLDGTRKWIERDAMFLVSEFIYDY